MRELNIGSLGGLYYELYDLSPEKRDVQDILKVNKDAEEVPAFLDLNGHFWSKLLSPSAIRELLDELRAEVDGWTECPMYFRIPAENPDTFVNRIDRAHNLLFEQSQSEKSFYQQLETLAVFCRIYSHLRGHGYELTLHEGFLLDSFSSLQLIRDCMNEGKNPYLRFLKENAWSEIVGYRPDCVWINGRLSLANMAVIRFVRQTFPRSYIFWAGEASEYYATNKITRYLMENEPLFEQINGIILFDYDETRKKVSQCIREHGDLENVANLLYKKRTGGNGFCIRKTPYFRYSDEKQPVITRRVGKGDAGWKVAPNELVNIHLFPGKTCFWRKCAFCGINSKYPKTICPTPKEEGWNILKTLECLAEIEKNGAKYFWAIDEAIPVPVLVELAEGLLDKKSVLKWQARSRISEKFLEHGVVETLARAGLKELRLGLESASLPILARMNKFDDTFSLDLVEGIVSAFSAEGIRIHFPMVIGFPGETEADRNRTYMFLEYLRERYGNFSFNINIYAMDVGSPIFEKYTMYDVSKIEFPCSPKYFLGNLVKWDCAEQPFDEEVLKAERDDFMRQQLYPWMPAESFVSPHILYRLLETTRCTLFQEIRRNEGMTGQTLFYADKRKFLLLRDDGLTEDTDILFALDTFSALYVNRGIRRFLSYAEKPRGREELLMHLGNMMKLGRARARIFLQRLIDLNIIREEGEQKPCWKRQEQNIHSGMKRGKTAMLYTGWSARHRSSDCICGI